MLLLNSGPLDQPRSFATACSREQLPEVFVTYCFSTSMVFLPNNELSWQDCLWH
jgi:hypothetical protein